MYICLCKGITDHQIRSAIDDGASSVRELHDQLGVASQCGKCGKAVKHIISESIHSRNTPPPFYPA